MKISSHSPGSCISLQKSSISKITFKINGHNCTETQYFLKTTYQLSSIHTIKMGKRHTVFSSKTVTVFFLQITGNRSIASKIIHYATVSFKSTHKTGVVPQMVKYILGRGEKILVKKCFLPMTFMN